MKKHVNVCTCLLISAVATVLIADVWHECAQGSLLKAAAIAAKSATGTRLTLCEGKIAIEKLNEFGDVVATAKTDQQCSIPSRKHCKSTRSYGTFHSICFPSSGEYILISNN